ncbi:hypothetical protein C8R46DRAFT_1107533 [Mycena filopes]|nr:hypothetical protein C8R46DRAFT_1107533 [Mycena filopes]
MQRTKLPSSLISVFNLRRTFSRRGLLPSFLVPRPQKLGFSRSLFQRSADPFQLFSSVRNSSGGPAGTGDHGPDCECEDPEARLTKATLETLIKFSKTFLVKPCPPVTDDDVAFTLGYLRASDIPPADTSCCTQTLAITHAMAALKALTWMLTKGSPSAPIVQHTVQAWPDLEEWIAEIFTSWLVGGRLRRDEMTMVSGYTHILDFFTNIVLHVPEVRKLMLTEPSRERTLSMLLFCWTIEESMAAEDGVPPFLSAALPLASLFARDHKPEVTAAVDLFRTLKALRVQFDPVRELLDVEYTPDAIARRALSLVRNPNNSTSGHRGVLHVRMLNLFAQGSEYSDALLAQHSVRDVTRYLHELTSESQKFVQAGINPCVEYLTSSIPKKDGFSNARMALQAGLLPALLRSAGLLVESDADLSGLEKLLHIISLYLIYPSARHAFSVSVQKIKQLDDINRDTSVYAAYQKLVRLIDDRLITTQRWCSTKIETGAKCAKCGKDDNASTLRACTGCVNVSYCSENCQKEHWSSHEAGCNETTALRKAGTPLDMSQSDADGIFQFAMSQINLRAGEIARVWKEEGPTRTPLICFDFTEDPMGVLTVGKRCVDTLPGSTRATGGVVYFHEMKVMIDAAGYYNSLWLETISRKVHDEHGIVCVYVPQGETPKGKWMLFSMNPDLVREQGTVFEKLVRTVEDGIEFGDPHPDPVF